MPEIMQTVLRERNMILQALGRAPISTIRPFLYAVAVNLLLGCGSGGGSDDSVQALDFIAQVNPSISDLSSGQLTGEYSELQVALTKFSLLFEPIDGAVGGVVVGSEPISATHTLATLQRLQGELSPEHSEAIQQAIRKLIQGSTLVYSSIPEIALAKDALSADRDRQARRYEDLPECDGSASELVCGSALLSQTYLILELGGEYPRFRVRVDNTIDDLGFTYTGPDGICEIVVAVSDNPDRDSIASTVAREIFHCWHWGNYPESFYSSPGWLMAGLGEWFSADFTGHNQASRDIASAHSQSSHYKLFQSNSSAVGFFWQIDHLFGPGVQLWVLVHDLAQQTSSAEAFELATDAIPAAELIGLATSPTFSQDRGPLWTFEAPVSALTPRQPAVIASASEGRLSAAPGDQYLAFTDWGLAEAAWIDIQTDGTVLQRWNAGEDIVSTDSTQTRWCSDGICECADGTRLFPEALAVPEGDAGLTLGLVGGSATSSEVSWAVTDVSELCDDENGDSNDTTGDAVSTLVGTWRANPLAIAAAYEDTFDGSIDVAGVTGDVLLIIRPNGQATLRYDDVNIFLNDEGIQSVILYGSGTLDWRTSSGQLIFSNTSDFSFTSTTNAFIGGEVEAFTLNLDDINVGGSSSTSEFTVSNDTLTIHSIEGSHGAIFIPLLWNRQ